MMVEEQVTIYAQCESGSKQELFWNCGIGA